MSLPLDFKSISTWENIDFVTACLRMSCTEKNQNSYHAGALKVSADLFKRIENTHQRAHFFLNCEELGLRSRKLFYAYKYTCHGNYENLFRCVLNRDEVLVNTIKSWNFIYS